MSSRPISSGRTDSAASWLDPESNQRRNVHLAFEARAAARRTRESGRNEFLRRPFVPRVGAVRSNTRGGLIDDRRRMTASPHFVRSRGGNRHTPGAAATHTSQGGSRPCCKMRSLWPQPHPLHLIVDLIDRRPDAACGRPPPSCASFRIVHADEPLGGGRKITGLWQRQRVRIGVRERFARPQTPTT